jgi:hypothetical protein
MRQMQTHPLLQRARYALQSAMHQMQACGIAHGWYPVP